MNKHKRNMNCRNKFVKLKINLRKFGDIRIKSSEMLNKIKEINLNGTKETK